MSVEQPQPSDSADAVAAFLGSLRSRVQHMPQTTPLPDESDARARQVDSADDLVSRFVQAAQDAGCHLHESNSGDWTDVIRTILREHDAASVLIEAAPGSALSAERAAELGGMLADAGITVFSVTPDDAALFAVDIGITGVVAAIAETGTIVCTSGSAITRGSSLIPPVHIALVASSQIVADLCDFFEGLDGDHDLPANVNLISGPSKTADIEGILVTGVHGPGHVHIVLLRNGSTGPDQPPAGS